MQIRILKTELVNWRSIEPLQPANFKHIYNYKYIERSILENGFVNPFFVWESEGVIYSIDGVTRKEILSNLENVPDLLPAVFIDARNRQDAVKILLSVFNTKENPIDLEVLTEWVNIEQVEVEVTSLNVVDLTDIEEETEVLEAKEDDFDSTPPETPETVLGDLYEIGEHRLLCGDSTDSDQVAKLMNGNKADMVFTDPPYGVDYKGINNDDRGGLEDLLNSAFQNYLLNVKNGASIYCFHSDRCADIFHKVFREFCHFSSMIIWEKESIVLSQTDYQSKHESCLYGWFDNGTHKWYSDRKQESIWIAKSKREEGHTTPNPIEIVSKALNNSSLESHLIFDLFLGSGSTMVASHQLKRKCYGMELDPKYCDVIVKRMIKQDSNLKIKRNGIDETKKWLNKL